MARRVFVLFFVLCLVMCFSAPVFASQSESNHEHDYVCIEDVLPDYDELGNLIDSGHKVFRCSVCQDEYTHVHSLTFVDLESPSCVLSGKRSFSCSDCDYSESLVLPASGHDWVFVETVDPVYDYAGDIVTEGYTLYRCSHCDEELISKDALLFDDVSSGSSLFSSLVDKIIQLLPNGSLTVPFELVTVYHSVQDIWSSFPLLVRFAFSAVFALATFFCILKMLF